MDERKSPKDRVTTIMNELSSGKRAANGAWIERFGDNKPALAAKRWSRCSAWQRQQRPLERRAARRDACAAAQ